MKHIAFLLFFILGLFCCAGANPGDLTGEDAGLLLFRTGDHAVFAFQKIQRGPKGAVFRQCTPFKKNGTVLLSPEQCSVLEYLEEDLTPQIVEMEFFCSASHTNYAQKIKARVYANIARKINSPVISGIFAFQDELENDVRQVNAEINEYRSSLLKEARKQEETRRKNAESRYSGFHVTYQASPRRTGRIMGSRMPSVIQYRQNRRSYTPSCNPSPRSPENTYSAGNRNSADDELVPNDLKRLLDQAETGDLIRDCVKQAGNKNFFKAFCMYFMYSSLMTRQLRHLPGKTARELSREITKLEGDLCLKFQQKLHNTLAGENSYRSLCRMHGPWEYAPLRDHRSIRKRIDTCCKAWHTLYNHSAHTEFPKRGNAVLEVLQEKCIDNGKNTICSSV